MNYKEEFVRFLLESGALKFGDFTLKSGRRSPYMINTGALDSGESLSRLGCFYARAIHEKMELGVIPQDTSILFGSAYKGIPLAAAASIALAAAFDINLGYAFNRKETKDHGEGGIFVGRKPGPGDRILVVDDVMTAGTALRDTVDLIGGHAPEAKVVGSVIAVDRKEHGKDLRLSAVAEVQYELGIPVFSIVEIDEIVAVLKSPSFAESPDDARDAGEDGMENEGPVSIYCDICERKYKNAVPLALPTPAQIASIEEYLKANRPT
ncbi:MAG: orotate phosphoribosyltransferase [Clostridiales Family XIII bacterium]|nr:orotate phosphoribosyltransferase [Clostridiales Family XIII bacterium]